MPEPKTLRITMNGHIRTIIIATMDGCAFASMMAFAFAGITIRAFASINVTFYSLLGRTDGVVAAATVDAITSVTCATECVPHLLLMPSQA